MQWIKKIFVNYWQPMKNSFKKISEETKFQFNENDDDHHTFRVNPTTGAPMISSTMDCTGTPIGMFNNNNQPF